MFTSVVSLTNAPSGAEYSMPFLAPDASAVYYATGTGANMGLMKRTLATGATAVFDAPAGLQTYYPIVRGDGMVFYARWKDSGRPDLYEDGGPGVDAERVADQRLREQQLRIRRR